MSDIRFWTVCDELDELTDTVDVDGIDDLGTLLRFLFARPVGVHNSWNDDTESYDPEITIAGMDQQAVSIQAFPMSVVQLVRSCAQTLATLGPYVDDAGAPAEESFNVLTSSNGELTTALQRALGEVRLFKMMYPNEEA